MQLLRPTQLSSADELPPGARRQLAALGGGGLEALLETLDAAVPEAAAAGPLLKLALLLSAAAAGTGRAEAEAQAEEDPDPQTVLRRRAATSRHQVRACADGRVGACWWMPAAAETGAWSWAGCALAAVQPPASLPSACHPHRSTCA